MSTEDVSQESKELSPLRLRGADSGDASRLFSLRDSSLLVDELGRMACETVDRMVPIVDLVAVDGDEPFRST